MSFQAEIGVATLKLEEPRITSATNIIFGRDEK
jgi:hypothetical protein